MLSVSAYTDSGIDTGKSHTLFREAMTELLGARSRQKSPEKTFKKFEQLDHTGWKTAQHMLGNMCYKGERTIKR